MQIRSSLISASIARAICEGAGENEDEDEGEGEATETRSLDLYGRLVAFFSFFRLPLTLYRWAVFDQLRCRIWELDHDEYLRSFEVSSRASSSSRAKDGESELVPVGDLGYSGSTFFTTVNGKYLIKSLPRRFEHEFFTHDLFDGYVAHMTNHPTSLLVRITDMAYTTHATLGGILGMAPTHHIVMENLLYGRPKYSDHDEEEEEEDDEEGGGRDWETYDLKPEDYFFPERDIADGMLAPESVKAGLVDKFPGKVVVTPGAKQELVELLEADTQLLADNMAVDYSLFLVRYPRPHSAAASASDDAHAHGDIPVVSSKANAWRTGVHDIQGRWTYRAVVLDFFWAKHKFQAQAMTGLVKTFNFFASKGPMSITADPEEYRERFMKMVNSIVKGQGE